MARVIGLLPMGGRQTRLRFPVPKPLMPIGDMPILEILLRQMRHSGIDEVVLTIGHLAHLVQAFFQDGSQIGIPISFGGTFSKISRMEHSILSWRLTTSMRN